MKELLSAAKDCGTVLKWGVVSRLCLLTFQMVSHALIPDHAASMEDVFMSGYRHPPHNSIIETSLGGFDNWDSEHFIFIAEHGYILHEQTMAFFPLFPSLLWALSHTLFYPLVHVLPLRSVLLISGCFLNLAVFPLTVASLYLLTLHVSRNRQLSLLTAALFCINPASVFMSAVYTECLFALFTFSGLLALEKERSWIATLLFMLAVATRSNGIVLCGYIGYQCLLKIFKSLTTHSLTGSISNVLTSIISTGIQCVMIVLPFAAFQYYGYKLYCTPSFTNPQLSTANPGASLPVWCNWSLPLPYNFIQQHYWNNGFLKYFQLKQIPNFLLATPMILLSCYCLLRYFTGYGTVGKKGQTRNDRMTRSWLGNEHMRPYAFHLGFLLVFGTFFMNVQVITRFICSASPMIFWFSADTVLSDLASNKAAGLVEPNLYSTAEMARRLLKTIYHTESVVTGSKVILSYFLVYVVLGFILHCNFYPWT